MTEVEDKKRGTETMAQEWTQKKSKKTPTGKKKAEKGKKGGRFRGGNKYEKQEFHSENASSLKDEKKIKVDETGERGTAKKETYTLKKKRNQQKEAIVRTPRKKGAVTER